MGLKLGRVLKRGIRSVVKRAPGIVTGFVSGGPVGALTGALAQRPARLLGGRFGPTGFLPGPGPVPGIQLPVLGDVEIPDPTQPPPIQTTPVQVPAVIAGMSAVVVRAITVIASAIGIRVTALTLPRVGMRAWRVVTGFARRHPGLSVISFLTSLGLVAEEAVEFLAWGEARSRRRRRRRGISAADMRITRRTMRRMIRFHSDLRAIAGPGARRRGRVGGGAITAVSAGG